MPFTPINTQEEFDEAVKERLARQEQSIRGEYADYEELKTKAAGADEAKADYEKQIKDAQSAKKNSDVALIRYKKAYEYKLPMDMADRLRGDTEADIDKDAKAMAAMIGKHRGGALPLRENEPKVPKDERRAALREMLAKMKEG